MKRYIDKETGNRIIIADTKTIKAIYKSIIRNGDGIIPLFARFPDFDMNKYMYGIYFEDTPWRFKYMTIIRPDIALACIINGDWEEVIK